MDRLRTGKSLRVAVLLGGNSPEREVSLASGICVASALELAGHHPRAVDPAEVDLVDIDWRQFDACFVALHGGAGEDGRVQRELDALNVPYTGCGPAASALAMCKSAAKQRWLEVGILTPDFVLAHAVEPMHVITDRARSLRYPLVVKPDSLGSSLGVQIVRNEDQLHNAFAECQLYDPCVIAERYIDGREFTVALIESRPLPLIEIITAGQVFTYQAKYHTTPNSPETDSPENDPPITRSFPAELTSRQIDRLEQTAVAAAEAIGTTGLVRVDLMLSSADEADEVFVLEINTSPGMTQQSLAPQAAFQDDIDMPTLCDYLVRQCLAQEVLR